jgi:hypothetical protein
MTSVKFKVGDIVSDTWYSFDSDSFGVCARGKVTKVTERSCYVKWWNGDTWRYDKPHLQFLEKYKL